jgi:ketosteroid isomerase-like protein
MSHDTLAAQVLAVEAARARALVDADVATLDRITSDDYVHVESTGKVRTKAQFLDGLRQGEYRFESFVVDENHVSIHGDTAVVTGSYHNVIRTRAGVQPVKHARHIRVYARRDGAWINVAHQATQTNSGS